MSLPFAIKQKLWIFVEHGLLEPCPQFIERRDHKFKFLRPPTELRNHENFRAWKQHYAGQMPEWVEKLSDPSLFYFKLRDIAVFVEELEAYQLLREFVLSYDAMRALSPEQQAEAKEKDLAPSVKPVAPAGPDAGASEALAAFAAAGGEGEAEGGEAGGEGEAAGGEGQDNADMALWE